MGELDQVIDNIKSASIYNENCLNDVEETLINQTVAIIKNRKRIPCTNCKYCLPCPQGVLIPKNFSFYNKYYSSNSEKNKTDVKNLYSTLLKSEEKASSCIKCGLCEKHCPQNLNIIDLLKDVKKTLE